jgi:2,3-dihydroxybenzoate-AMP ligase
MTASEVATPFIQVPAERAERYRERGWWRPEQVDQLVLAGAAARGDHCAVVAGERRLTYRELATAVELTARRLLGLGITPGQPVLVQLPNDLELVILTLALMRLGAPPVLTLPALREHELTNVLAATRAVAMAVPRTLRRFDHLALARRLRADSSLRWLLVSDQEEAGTDEVDLVRLCAATEQPGDVLADPAALPTPDPAGIAVLLLSSGTTGPPKAIPRGHEGYGYMIRAASELARLTPDSVYLAVMPATHGFVMGCPGVLGALATGATVVLGSAEDPRRALDLIERERVTHCALVPALVTQWVDHARAGDHDLSSLRVLQAGGARLHAATAAEAEQVLGCRIQQVYGMSEGLLNFTLVDDQDEVVFQTQGRPASPDDEILIVGDDDRPVAPGERGELLTRGPYTIAGYYRDPEANARAFTADGFYRTGDLVRQHPSGNLVVEGRVRDVINRGGEKISAEELEAVLADHPDLAACAVVAMPHQVLGETVCLVAVPENGAVDLREIRAYLDRRGMARYKLPEHLEVVEALPMKGVGKIDKVRLRALVADRTGR